MSAGKCYLILAVCCAWSGWFEAGAAEWPQLQNGPQPRQELDKQARLLRALEADPNARNLFVLDQQSGREAFVVPHWVTATFQHEHRMFDVNYRLHERQAVIKNQTDPNIYKIPSDSAWWVKADGPSWIGNLRTWHWTTPADDVRQVHRLDEQGVDVWEWCGVDCKGTGQKRDQIQKIPFYMRQAPYYLPFADVTPELARFLAHHLAPECRKFLDRVEENQPHWHAAYAEAILSSENGFMTPVNAYSLFLAKAWIVGEKPNRLARLLDVPWLKQGDLFYLHKLAETIEAYRWLGPAPYRPDHPIYLPLIWRGWWDFGEGALGDIGCYRFNDIFRILKLGHPRCVQASSTKVQKETCPLASMIHYDFPARSEMLPAVKLTWYDGGLKPRRPEELDPDRDWPSGGGMLFSGDEGKMVMLADTGPRLIPESKMQAYQRPPKTLPRKNVGWMEACTTGKAAEGNFEFAGPVTEVLLAGNVAVRTGKKLDWDGPNMKATNVPQASQYVQPRFRDGWSL